MPKWISLKKLLTRWEIEIFELLDHLQRGLQPYTKYGFPIDCPESHHSWHKLNDRIRGTQHKLMMAEGKRKRKNQHKSKHINPYKTKLLKAGKLEETKKDLRGELQKLKDEMQVIDKNNEDIDHRSWSYFIKPKNDTEMAKVISYLKNAKFKLKDINKYENNLKEEQEITSQVIKLINEVRKEVEQIYSAVKSVGFSSKLFDPEKRWKKAALSEWQDKKEDFKYIKEAFLQDDNLYEFNSSQERRDFISGLLKKLIEDNGMGEIGARRLYEFYNRPATKFRPIHRPINNTGIIE